jgi:quercetin dioxygenase-like cupin family protein
MRLFILAGLLLAGHAVAQAPATAVGPDALKFIGHQEIDKRISVPEPGRVYGAMVVPESRRKDNYVEFVRRLDHGNQVELHPHWIDQVTVLSGEGVVTYGGRPVNGKVAANGEVRADSQSGAQTKKLQPGDFVLVPAGQAHKFDAASGKSLTYVILKVQSE